MEKKKCRPALKRKQLPGKQQRISLGCGGGVQKKSIAPRRDQAKEKFCGFFLPSPSLLLPIAGNLPLGAKTAWLLSMGKSASLPMFRESLIWHVVVSGMVLLESLNQLLGIYITQGIDAAFP